MRNDFLPSSAARRTRGAVLAIALGATVSAPSSSSRAQSALRVGPIARTFELRALSIFARTFGLFEGGVEVGRVEPVGWLNDRARFVYP